MRRGEKSEGKRAEKALLERVLVTIVKATLSSKGGGSRQIIGTGKGIFLHLRKEEKKQANEFFEFGNRVYLEGTGRMEHKSKRRFRKGKCLPGVAKGGGGTKVVE